MSDLQRYHERLPEEETFSVVFMRALARNGGKDGISDKPPICQGQGDGGGVSDESRNMGQGPINPGNGRAGWFLFPMKWRNGGVAATVTNASPSSKHERRS